MPTALSRRSGAVYGEKSPKTRLARIYCYGNTINIVNMIHLGSDVCVVHCIKRLPSMPLSPGSDLGGFYFFFFLIYLKGLCHGFLASLLTAKIYICVAGKVRQIMAHFC